MDKNTLEVFKEVEAALADICSTGPCDECAFNCNGYCGTEIMQSVMTKLAGAEEAGLDQQHYSDNSLHDFIFQNKKE